MNIQTQTLTIDAEQYDIQYVEVLLAHHDNLAEPFQTRIQLGTSDFGEQNQAFDDTIFWYCDDVAELESLTKADNGEDFQIIEIL